METSWRIGKCYIRIETERAGRHFPRPYGERDIWAAYGAGMSDARVEQCPGVENGQRGAKPPMPEPTTREQREEDS